MKVTTRNILTAACVALLAGCAVGERLGWHREAAPAREVVLANCDAATATLKGRPDHDTAYGACVAAKKRQNVD